MEKDDKPNDVYSYKQEDSFNGVFFFSSGSKWCCYL